MTIKHTMGAYHSSVAWCDGCSKSMNKDEYSFHCPKRGTVSLHSSGFDYCFDCAQRKYNQQKKDKLNNELNIIYNLKYNQINQENINKLMNELSFLQSKELKIMQALNAMIDSDEKKENYNNNNIHGFDKLKKLDLTQTTLHQNINSLQKLVNTQKTMNPLILNLLNKHCRLISNWKEWNVTDVIHWFINIDNGEYKQYQIELTKGITKENVKGKSLKYIDDSCLLRWGVFDIEKRNKLLSSIKNLISDKNDTEFGGMLTNTPGQQEGQ